MARARKVVAYTPIANNIGWAKMTEMPCHSMTTSRVSDVMGKLTVCCLIKFFKRTSVCSKGDEDRMKGEGGEESRREENGFPGKVEIVISSRSAPSEGDAG